MNNKNNKNKKKRFSQAPGVVSASLSNPRIVPDFDRLGDTVREICVKRVITCKICKKMKIITRRATINKYI